MADLTEKPDADASIYLHAELLPNIRHITLYISLPSHLNTNNTSPTITLSESRQAVTVSLPGPFSHVSDTIKLPARVNEASRHTLNTSRQAPTQPANDSHSARQEYSFRMRIDSEDDALPRTEAVDDFVPWTAADMGPSSKLRCRRCAGLILDAPGLDSADSQMSDASDGWVWKDLPSGNWAEMMDFWHCHKPDPEDHGHGDGEDGNAQTKGYGAANQVVARRGTVLVDVVSFLVAEEDCRGVKKVQTLASGETPKDSSSLACDTCDSLLGTEDPVAQGWRLFKTSLSATIANPSTPQPTWHSPPTESIIAAQLLELIERESTRRFVIHSGHSSGLLLWAFNPDFRYSNSSAEHSVTAQRAVKIFFQEIADVDSFLDPGRGRPALLSVEEVRVPVDVMRELRGVLEERNAMLPGSAREFREWRVGMLHRVEKGE
ncbi:HECT-type E3 ubiquitin transferase [Aspergillus clavatus NRRL 1]|uniref:Ubiquitin-conjugating enzyme E2-binding protein n=1 Tax=Aspergillus clavatus (strain ATCC 1007 / CBS 513.65 / DSM 816 / NCTC 3887 / NRRL 1 / QM 1276 / 107) TaxID=344612 RepID=A1CJR3_ASPCL|nr:uncharacterized protein ACLA_035900 [Aspergillus clavatus NRRL 1]EAW09387.1 conserved hypothetical protein [Aspergillus clavatus NRRL 1]